MKTIYQAPTLRVVEIRAKRQLLVESNVAVGNAYQEGDAVLSRKGGFFDDEDEE